jgi:hypothetical protein
MTKKISWQKIQHWLGRMTRLLPREAGRVLEGESKRVNQEIRDIIETLWWNQK